MEYKLIRNDITNMKVDAVVLPANTGLKIGSGTSKAIFEKAGRKELEAACKKIGKTAVGNTVVTEAYGLDASFILHSVVPKWTDGEHGEIEMLSKAYLSALVMADDLQCRSIAIPLLCSGNNGFDLELAYHIAKESIKSYDAMNRLTDVYLVVYSTEVVAMLKQQGVYVEEHIDGWYVINKDERHITPLQALLEQGKGVAELYIQDGKEYVLDYAGKALQILEEPETRRKIESLAAQCAKAYIQKKITPKIGGAVKGVLADTKTTKISGSMQNKK